MSRPQVTVIGAGMIMHDQILPSLYHLQRQGVIGELTVCDARVESVRSLAESALFARAFPGQSFHPYPALDADPEQRYTELYREVIAAQPARNIVVAAVPDQFHHQVVMTALRHDQHVMVVKPLVLKAAEGLEIEREARQRGLAVGIEYHKRFDDRALLARRRYREGFFGEFKLGTSRLLEKWYYRESNFQNWCTIENSDAFTYIGCHYVDQVHYITGMLPTAVSVYGIVDQYPNGRDGYLWTDARVIWENGACLNCQNALGFPDAAGGTNVQGLTMYFSGNGNGAWLEHDDQYRGIQHCYTEAPSPPSLNRYAEPSTDYFQYLDLGGPGLVPTGYGLRSIEHIIKTCIRVEDTPPEQRSAVLDEIDANGIIATPANSRFNELVVEAGRLSIQNAGREARIEYGDHPHVHL